MKVLKLAIFLGLATICLASSHSEAPGSAANPNGDLTDVYLFRSYEPGREDFVTFLINIRPLQDPFGGPNYFSLSDEVFYEINIDQNHDCVEDLTFQMYYGNSLGGDTCDPSSTDCIGGHKGIEIPVGDQSVAVPLKFIGQVSGDGGSVQNLNWFEWYQINKVTPNRNGNQVPITKTGSSDGVFGKPFDNAGTKSFPDYESYSRQFIYEIDIPGCNAPTPHGKTFLGQRRESFFVKLGPIFDLINFIPIPGFPGGVEENNDRNNDLQWKNIDTWAFEIHKDCVLGPNSQNIIAAWASVRTLNHAGGAHTPGEQINRLAQPLVNEVVIGLRDKNKFNSAVPSNDGQFATYITNPTFPALVNILFRDAVNAVLGTHIPNLAPPTPRSDLVTAFLTGVPGVNKPDSPNNLCEQMRLNVAIDITPQSKQKRYGVLAGDNAGMPNGRRPGDDALDITVQVAMGALCELGIGCQPADAPVGSVQFTDGAPTSANQFQNQFPYLNTPCAGSDGKSCGFNFNPDCPECPTCAFCPVFPEYPPAVTCSTESSSSSPSSPPPSGPTPSSPSGPTVVSGASSISASVVLLLFVLALFL